MDRAASLILQPISGFSSPGLPDAAGRPETWFAEFTHSPHVIHVLWQRERIALAAAACRRFIACATCWRSYVPIHRRLLAAADRWYCAARRGSCSRQAAYPPELSTQVDKLFEKFDSTVTPGCALSVMQAGRIVYKRGYGMADLDHDVPIRPDTVFHVASISKQFTDAAIVLLAQEGKLSLDDDVREICSGIARFWIADHDSPPDPSHQRTAGSMVAAGLGGMAVLARSDYRPGRARRHVGQKDLNFQPGEKHTYCNTGYTLLAQIVKRVSGKSFREFTTQRIFEPLGMRSTHFRDDHAEVVKHIAYGYERGKGDGEFSLSVTNFDTVGATSLLTTVEDLALWDENFYAPRVGGAELIAQMLVKGKLNSGKELDYAFGLVHGKYKGLATVDHGGADAGYRADLLRFPGQHFSVACLCNLAQTNPGELARKVADIYLAAEMKDTPSTPAPSAETPVSLTPQQLAAFAGLYWNREEEGAVKVILKDEKLSAVFSPEDSFELKPLTGNRFRLAGPPITMEFTRNKPGDPPTMRFQRDGADHADTLESMPEFKPGPAQLASFAGTYRSEEIDPVYRLVVEDGSLVLKRLKSKPDKLVPTIADYFSSSSGSLHFTRNSQSQVTGFVLNTGRIRGMKFRKSS